MITTTRGLTIWDLEADPWDHNQLKANWELVESYWTGFDATTKLPKRIHTTATIPGSAVANDVVMLTADVANTYKANTLIRYDGSAWRPVNHLEIHSSVPTAGLFAGRVVILSAAASGFDAWNIIRYDGSTWELVGGWKGINNGAGATNIKGLQIALDSYISDSARGFVIKDRATGSNYRLFISNGNLQHEVVT